MLRGEIRLVDFDPSVGSEANKRRPALIVSNDHANAAAARLGRGVVTVIPLTIFIRPLGNQPTTSPTLSTAIDRTCSA